MKQEPDFLFSGDEITISGNSIMEDPVIEWGSFITSVRIYLSSRKKVIINFKMDIVNSSNSLYITNLFSVLNEFRLSCDITVNWFYLEPDEDNEFLGEMYKDRNKKLIFNLKKVSSW